MAHNSSSHPSKETQAERQTAMQLLKNMSWMKPNDDDTSGDNDKNKPALTKQNSANGEILTADIS